MLSLICSGFIPSALATAGWSMPWNCSPFQISQESAPSFTTQLRGSIGACARYGNWYSASMTFAPDVTALPMSPFVAATEPGCCTSLRYSVKISDEEYLKPDSSSHCTFSASRPFLAAQNVVATTATPLGTCTT